MEMLRKIIIVAWCVAREARSCFSGTGVLPALRVKMTVWDTSGRVSSVESAAADAVPELTPGIIVKGILLCLNRAVCSLIAP